MHQQPFAPAPPALPPNVAVQCIAVIALAFTVLARAKGPPKPFPEVQGGYPATRAHSICHCCVSRQWGPDLPCLALALHADERKNELTRGCHNMLPHTLHPARSSARSQLPAAPAAQGPRRSRGFWGFRHLTKRAYVEAARFAKRPPRCSLGLAAEAAPRVRRAGRVRPTVAPSDQALQAPPAAPGPARPVCLGKKRTKQ